MDTLLTQPHIHTKRRQSYSGMQYLAFCILTILIQDATGISILHESLQGAGGGAWLIMDDVGYAIG